PRLSRRYTADRPQARPRPVRAIGAGPGRRLPGGRSVRAATRRSALALLGAGVLTRAIRAESRLAVDSAGRNLSLPDRVSRVFVAGPPAAVLMYVLAPDMMVGWVGRPTAAEKEFLVPPARDLPETGRLTGRGDTVSLERLVAAKPDLVVDFGSVT